MFGNRVAFQRDTYNGDIVLTRSSEPLVERTAGDDRYETAVAASAEYFRGGADNVVLCTDENFPDALMADGRPFSNMAFVARGDSFADALSVAPLAAATYSPIILVKTQASLPPASEDLFESLPIWDAYIAGGTNVVSVGVEEEIEVWTTYHFGMDSLATRMAGVDRYEASVCTGVRSC